MTAYDSAMATPASAVNKITRARISSVHCMKVLRYNALWLQPTDEQLEFFVSEFARVSSATLNSLQCPPCSHKSLAEFVVCQASPMHMLTLPASEAVCLIQTFVASTQRAASASKPDVTVASSAELIIAQHMLRQALAPTRKPYIEADTARISRRRILCKVCRTWEMDKSK